MTSNLPFTPVDVSVPSIPPKAKAPAKPKRKGRITKRAIRNFGGFINAMGEVADGITRSGALERWKKFHEAHRDCQCRRCKQAWDLHDATRYKLHEERTASGRNVYDNCDPVADALRGLSLGEQYELVAKEIGEKVTTLLAKYQHLNPGQQRMALGNRLRKVWKAA